MFDVDDFNFHWGNVSRPFVFSCILVLCTGDTGTKVLREETFSKQLDIGFLPCKTLSEVMFSFDESCQSHLNGMWCLLLACSLNLHRIYCSRTSQHQFLSQQLTMNTPVTVTWGTVFRWVLLGTDRINPLLNSCENYFSTLCLYMQIDKRTWTYVSMLYINIMFFFSSFRKLSPDVPQKCSFKLLRTFNKYLQRNNGCDTVTVLVLFLVHSPVCVCLLLFFFPLPHVRLQGLSDALHPNKQLIFSAITVVIYNSHSSCLAVACSPASWCDLCL